MMPGMKVLLFANTEWYLHNFRLPLAREIRRRGAEVVMVSPPGPYAERLRAEGFRWLPLTMNRRGVNPLAEWRTVRELIGIYRRERPDVAHHFTIKPVVYGSIAARAGSVPAIVNAVAGMGYVFIGDTLLARSLRPVVRATLKFALGGQSTRVIVQNPDDRTLLVSAGLASAQNTRLIRGSGVDIRRFRPTEPAPARKPRVLLATRLLWDKGIGEFIEAARQLQRAGISAEFVLAGVSDSGNPSAVPQQEIERWAEEGVATALGHVEDMPGLLAGVDIVVLPSYREGLPRILLEAAASGIPIVTTDVPGCREIVEHESNGLLVPVKDAGALAAAIRRLIESPATRARFGASGRRRVLAEFDERIVIADTLKVYDELLPSQSDRPAFSARAIPSDANDSGTSLL
jgi:glycosyltransferase involved in cell wall biosynthesis